MASARTLADVLRLQGKRQQGKRQKGSDHPAAPRGATPHFCLLPFAFCLSLPSHRPTRVSTSASRNVPTRAVHLDRQAADRPVRLLEPVPRRRRSAATTGATAGSSSAAPSRFPARRTRRSSPSPSTGAISSSSTARASAADRCAAIRSISAPTPTTSPRACAPGENVVGAAGARLRRRHVVVPDRARPLAAGLRRRRRSTATARVRCGATDDRRALRRAVALPRMRRLGPRHAAADCGASASSRSHDARRMPLGWTRAGLRRRRLGRRAGALASAAGRPTRCSAAWRSSRSRRCCRARSRFSPSRRWRRERVLALVRRRAAPGAADRRSPLRGRAGRTCPPVSSSNPDALLRADERRDHRAHDRRMRRLAPARLRPHPLRLSVHRARRARRRGHRGRRRRGHARANGTTRRRRSRASCKGQPHGAQVFRYIARPGVQRFERFEWSRGALRAGHGAQRAARPAHPPRRLDLHPLSRPSRAAPSSAPTRCSTRLWEIGRYTLQLCMHDGWEDCPGREQRQWLGDATVEFLVGQVGVRPQRQRAQPPVPAPRRREPAPRRADADVRAGRPSHQRDADSRLDAAVDPQRRAALAATPASSTSIEAIFPAIQRALAWFERQIDAHDLVADLPYWHFMDWAALGRHGEAATLNAAVRRRACAPRRALARGARVAARRAALRRRSATRIAAALDARHWDARRGVYVDCRRPGDRRARIRASRSTPTRAMILWDVAPRDALGVDDRVHHRSGAPHLHRRAADRARTASRSIPRPTSCSPTPSTATSSTARSAAPAASISSLRLMRERYGRMLARGATTLWESFEPTASLCHGFSATPVYQLSTEVLGVTPLAPGFAPLPRRAAAGRPRLGARRRSDRARRHRGGVGTRAGTDPDRRDRAGGHRGGDVAPPAVIDVTRSGSSVGRIAARPCGRMATRQRCRVGRRSGVVSRRCNPRRMVIRSSRPATAGSHARPPSRQCAARLGHNAAATQPVETCHSHDHADDKINGIELYYEEQGDGEPLLLIMGLAADSVAWMFQLPAFAERLPHHRLRQPRRRPQQQARRAVHDRADGRRRGRRCSTRSTSSAPTWSASRWAA